MNDFLCIIFTINHNNNNILEAHIVLLTRKNIIIRYGATQKYTILHNMMTCKSNAMHRLSTCHFEVTN